MEYIIVIVLVIILAIFIIIPFHPRIELITFGKKGYKILLWYTEYEGDKTVRKYKILIEHEDKR